MISNNGSDEKGNYHGGTAGDQTGKEWQLRSWYNRPWKCILRFPENVRKMLAEDSKAAAENNNIGYDQWQRMTFYNELKANNWNVKNINKPCESDCSSGVTALVIAAGNKLGIDALKKINPNTTTFTMRSRFKEAGAEILKDKKYLTSDEFLLEGDILLNDEKHCAINVSNGSGAVAPKEPTKPVESKKVTDEIVNKVIRGDYGNGEERKKKLTAEGYNYDEVQKAVNEKLKAKPSTPTPEPKKEETSGFVPYLVKVDIPNLNIRTSPEVKDNNKTGKFTGIGVFTIVDEKNGWGKLKSGAGWISLNYTKRV